MVWRSCSLNIYLITSYEQSASSQLPSLSENARFDALVHLDVDLSVWLTKWLLSQLYPLSTLRTCAGLLLSLWKTSALVLPVADSL